MPFDNHERISGHPPGDIDRAPRTGQHQVLTPQIISGRLTQMRFPAGGNLWRTNTYAPFGQQDSNGGRLTAIQVGTTQGGSDRLNLGYSYDSFGNISSWTINSALNNFSYDSQNRVTSAFGLSYAYDVAGRFTSFEGTTPIYVNHRLTDFGTQDYYYDNNGNQTYRRWGLSDQQALTWNHENRLRNLSSTSYTESYTYDADGQRILKISNGVSTFYPNQYYEASGSNVTKYYYFGSQRIAMRKNGVLTYLHPDRVPPGRGSTAMSTDTGGAVTVNQGYYAYGRYRSGGTLPTDRRYTGQQRDDTGLYYYNARYYDPLLGTFLSPDTLVPDPGNVQAYNRYMYTLGNPLRYNDPTGHSCNSNEGFVAPLNDDGTCAGGEIGELSEAAGEVAVAESVGFFGKAPATTGLESAEGALAGQYPQAQNPGAVEPPQGLQEQPIIRPRGPK